MTSGLVRRLRCCSSFLSFWRAVSHRNTSSRSSGGYVGSWNSSSGWVKLESKSSWLLVSLCFLVIIDYNSTEGCACGFNWQSFGHFRAEKGQIPVLCSLLCLFDSIAMHTAAWAYMDIHEVVAVYTGAVTGHMAVMSTYWGEISRDFTVRMGFRRKPFGTFRAESVMSKDCHRRLTEESGDSVRFLTRSDPITIVQDPHEKLFWHDRILEHLNS